MWCILPAGAARADVNKKCGGGEGIWTETRGHIRMEQECTNTIVESAKYAFSATILLRGVWTGETEDGAVGGKEGADGDVVELLAVISLEGVYGATELGVTGGVPRGHGDGKVSFSPLSLPVGPGLAEVDEVGTGEGQDLVMIPHF